MEVDRRTLLRTSSVGIIGTLLSEVFGGLERVFGEDETKITEKSTWEEVLKEGEHLTKEGKYKDAIDIFELYRENNPEDPLPYKELGLTHRFWGNSLWDKDKSRAIELIQTSIKFYTTAIEKNIANRLGRNKRDQRFTSFNCYFGRGLAHEKLSHAEDAVRDYREALAYADSQEQREKMQMKIRTLESR